jgi:nucleoside 2-deoxyribosyltransferase
VGFHLSNALRPLRGVKSIEEYLALRYGQNGVPPSIEVKEISLPVRSPSQPTAEYVPGTAFIMMPIQRQDPSNTLVHETLKQTFASFDIRAERADDIDHDGKITELILTRIRESEFLIADLTGERPSVYYEIGYAHALRKRVMIYRREGTPVHFDLSVHNAPAYVDEADLKKQLTRRLTEAVGRSPRPN